MNKAKIYIASKTKHAGKWIAIRESGVNIISTWIDEAGDGANYSLSDLAERCVQECMDCDSLIVYREEDEYLKGAFIEMGIALANYVPVYLVGPVLPKGSVFTYVKGVNMAESVESAIRKINSNII